MAKRTMAKRTMAKRTRASARDKRASKISANIPEKTARKTTRQKTGRKTRRKTPVSQTKNANLASRYVFTPELLDHARRSYEHTEASIAKIAFELGVSKNTVRRRAKLGSWLRYVRPPRGLPRAVQLKAQAGELESRVLGAAAATSAPASESGTDLPRAGGGDAMLPLSDTVERLYRAVLEELAAVENLRAQLKREPQSPQDAERTARTLSSLTETLQKLQRLQCAVPQSGSCDDDVPSDIDEFRTELARRIEAFVASRPDPGDGGGAIPASLDAAAR
jgi:hypothetical protein